MEGLPFGTRGGTLIKHQFPQDAEYVFRFNLANTTAGADLDVMLDGERIKLFNIARGGARRGRRRQRAAREARNPHEDQRRPARGRRRVREGADRAGRGEPPAVPEPDRERPGMASLRNVIITGPFESQGVRRHAEPRSGSSRAGPMRARAATSTECAQDDSLHARAARLPAAGRRRGPEDADGGVHRRAAPTAVPSTTGSSAGCSRSSSARSSCSASKPIHRRPSRARRTASAISSSRRGSRSSSGAACPTTSCSIWPRAGSCETRRCSSSRCGACSPTRARRRSTANFAGQWLQLRNLAAVTPSEVLFPDFDDTLRQALPARDRAVLRQHHARGPAASLDLLTADYTFLNERLARHYGIPEHQGQPLPPRDADRREPPRPARPGQHPDDHVASGPHVAGVPRQVDSRQPSRHAAARRRPPTCRRCPRRPARTPARMPSMRERMAAAPREPDLRDAATR